MKVGHAKLLFVVLIWVQWNSTQSRLFDGFDSRAKFGQHKVETTSKSTILIAQTTEAVQTTVREAYARENDGLRHIADSIEISEEEINHMSNEEYNLRLSEIIEDVDGSYVHRVGSYIPDKKLAREQHYYPDSFQVPGDLDDRYTQLDRDAIQAGDLKPLSSYRRKRAFYKSKFLTRFLWENAYVPYTDSDMTTDKFKGWINESISAFHKDTCLQWKPRNGEIEYIRFLGGDQDGICGAYVGKRSNRTSPIFLEEETKSCNAYYVVLHEMLHAIGRDHEQSRADRYRYIDIDWSCIKHQTRNNYQKFPSSLDVPYNYESISHYSPNLFNDCLGEGKGTMAAKDAFLDFLLYEIVRHFTHYDIKSIVEAYDCDAECVDICENAGFIRTTVDNPECHCLCPMYLVGETCSEIFNAGTCGSIIELQQGETKVITSTNYENGYYDTEMCVYLIKAPVGNRIELKFLDLDVSVNKSSNNGVGVCIHRLEVRYELLGQTGPRLCGLMDPSDIVTGITPESHLLMMVLDGTSEGEVGRGFKVEATAFQSGCLTYPCENGGTCKDDKEGSYTCICADGFSGDKDCNTVTASATVGCDVEKDLEGPCCMEDKLEKLEWFQFTPTDDHSKYTFLYATVVGAYNDTDEAVLESSVTFEPAWRCLQYYVVVVKNSKGNVDARLQSSYTDITGASTLLETTTDTGGSWNLIKETLPDVNGLKVVFKGRISSDGTVILDDILITPGPCIPCDSNPCKNGGTCTNSQNTAVCDCRNGYLGLTCSDSVCDDYECENGRCEIDESGAATCNCTPGYFKPDCVQNVCDTHECGNGRCEIDVSGSAYCICTPGYLQPDCSQSVCDDYECENGRCEIDESGAAYCNCTPGYFKPDCVQSVCDHYDCENGRCEIVESGSAYCFCTPGYLQPDCVQNVCDNHECGNGRCEIDASGSAYCICTPGYLQPDCVQSVCHNYECGNGRCEIDESGAANCNCTLGYFQPDCVQNVCDDYDCGNGRCEIDEAGFAYCVCTPGYLQPNCLQSVCDNYECGNGGCDIDEAGNAYCICTPGYLQPDCIQSVCDNYECGNGGCEIDEAGSAYCICTPGYLQPRCLQSVCDNYECGNGGCDIDEAGNAYCICAPGYLQPRCLQSVCDNYECGNGGCDIDEAGNAYCICTPGYLQPDCIQSVCDDYECGNGGCEIDEAGSAYCICTPGYLQPRCLQSVCDNYECGNGGCNIDEAGNAYCICTPGYLQPDCIQSVCDNYECGNGGCNIDEAGNAYCSCTVGYLQPDCLQSVCDNYECGNGGCDIDEAGNAYCICTPGYLQPDCIQSVCDSYDCGNGRCEIDEVESAYCNCTPGYLQPNCLQSVCDNFQCANGGCNIDEAGNAYCICSPGYLQPDCVQNVCDDYGCGNGGCEIDEAGNAYCICAPGYLQPDCTQSVCDNYDCGNGGCNTDEAGNAYCICTPGYLEPDCLESVCGNYECGNGGCDIDEAGSAYCICAPGYLQPDCLQSVCDNHECGNGGCDIDEAGSAYCICTPGYLQPDCLQRNDRCLCTYEKNQDDKCCFRNAIDDGFDWEVISGRTLTPGTGPFHAYSGDYYAHIDSSKNRRRKARLELKQPFDDGSRCLILNYNMYGRGIGCMYVDTENDGIKERIWAKVGNQWNRWRRAQIDVNTTDSTQIYIEATSSFLRGDTSIDDVEIKPYPCNKIIVCTFELGITLPCKRVGAYFRNDWKYRKRPTLTNNTGPAKANSGYFFIYIEASRRLADGRLEVVHNFTGAACLSLAYHMYGADIGRLSVYTTDNIDENVLWETSGDKGDTWFSVNVDIPSIDNLRVIVRGEKGDGEYGDIAIDDVMLIEQTCDNV